MPTCYVCSAPATTRDHIPPRGCFLNPRPTNTITVPSCAAHNNARAMDDEYFRLVLAVTCADDPRAEQLFDGAVTRGLQNSPGLLRSFAMGSISRLPVATPGGVVTGYRPGFRIDPDRFQAVIASMVRGIYFKEVGLPLLGGVPIAGYRSFDPSRPENQRLLSLLNRRFASDNGGDFMYFFGQVVDQPLTSMAVLVFYRVFSILTGTGSTNFLVNDHDAHVGGIQV